MAVGAYPIAVNHQTNQLEYSAGVTGLMNTPQPSDHGFLAWSYDPTGALNSQIIGVAGTVYISRIFIRDAITVTSVVMQLSNIGVTLTAGQNFAGLFNSSGVLLSATGDQAATWAGTVGTKAMALTTPQSIAADTSVYVGVFANGSTLPTFSRSVSAPQINANLSATIGSARYATADTGRTTSFPATLGALTLYTVGWWVALA